MENVSTLIVEHLRAIRADVSGIKEDMREAKQRLSNIEVGIGSIKGDISHLYTENATQHIRYDRLIDRLEKIEQRLELQS